jgi:hypothetical protein
VEVENMSLILLGAALAAVGVVFGRWWPLWLPATFGGGYFLGSLSGSLPQQDSPILFLVAVVELVMAAGIYARRRLALPT